MMNYKGWEIPEGKVIKVEDADGRVIWMLPSSGKPVILEVEKITSDTYAGETTYTGEQFILLDIYPKTNGTVKVTYGGLTKTITDTSGAEEPNAQQVFFGTFNGVSDSVTTPASGELTIKGDFVMFGHGTYAYSNKLNYSCPCITNVVNFGAVEHIPDNAFSGNLETASKITNIQIPDGVESIGKSAFSYCQVLTSIELPDSLKSIGDTVFTACRALPSLEIPNSVESIGNYAFQMCDSLIEMTLPTNLTIVANSLFSNCDNLRSVAIPNGVTSIGESAFINCVSLANITIPPKVNSIGNKAFYACKNLASVILLPTTPPTVSGNAELFHGSANRPTIIVPKGCGSAYKSATHWSTYADYIVEAS